MEQLKEIFYTLFTQFRDVFPKLLGAVGLLIVGWILAKVFSSIIKKLLISIKADRVTDKLLEIDIIQKANIDVKLSTALSKIIYYFLLLTFIIAATEFLGLTIVSQQIAELLNYIPQLIAASIVFLAGVVLANFVRNAINTTFISLNIPSGKLISGFIFYFLLITISISALSQAGMDTAFLTQNIQIVLGGIVVAFAVGFGYASRPVLKNILAAGYSKRKFQIGMSIRIGEYEGQIIDIDNTAVTLSTDTGSQIIIPQSEVITAKVEVLRN